MSTKVYDGDHFKGQASEASGRSLPLLKSVAVSPSDITNLDTIECGHRDDVQSELDKVLDAINDLHTRCGFLSDEFSIL
jgi:hypothetical protein